MRRAASTAKDPLYLEDDAYDPKKAVLATQKLIELDKVFSILSPMGSATTSAAAADRAGGGPSPTCSRSPRRNSPTPWIRTNRKTG